MVGAAIKMAVNLSRRRLAMIPISALLRALG